MIFCYDYFLTSHVLIFLVQRLLEVVLDDRCGKLWLKCLLDWSSWWFLYSGHYCSISNLECCLAASPPGDSTLHACKFLPAVTGSEYMPVDSIKIQVESLSLNWVYNTLTNGSQLNFVHSFTGMAIAMLSVSAITNKCILKPPQKDVISMFVSKALMFCSTSIFYQLTLIQHQIPLDHWVNSLTSNHHLEYNAL